MIARARVRYAPGRQHIVIAYRDQESGRQELDRRTNRLGRKRVVLPAGVEPDDELRLRVPRTKTRRACAATLP